MKQVLVVLTVISFWIVSGISGSSPEGITDQQIEQISPSGDAESEHETDSESASDAKSEPIVVQSDDYDGYESWCEDIYKMSCDPDDEHPCGQDRTGRSQHCTRPAWARREGKRVYQCRPNWLNRREQKERKENLSVIVNSVCRVPDWADDLSKWGKANRYGGDAKRLCWRLKGGSKALDECQSGHFCQPDKLLKYLSLVAARESTWQNQTTHELNPDLDANRSSYAKARKRGWYESSNHFGNPDRWLRGYGWYGHNASLHVFFWDRSAPPEILCRQVESTEVHLRKMRRSFKKLWAKYGDDKKRTYTLDTGETVKVRGVTWYDIHRASSGGKLTPESQIKTRRWSKKKKTWVKAGFIRRAKARKLDPFETVMWEMLGDPIPKDRQNDVADEIRAKMATH